jgi:hypothetical protein
VAVVMLGIYLPLGRERLGTERLDAAELGIVLALAIIPSVLIESAKLLRRWMGRG